MPPTCLPGRRLINILELSQKDADDPNQPKNILDADLSFQSINTYFHTSYSFEKSRLTIGCLIPAYRSVRGNLVDIPSNDRKWQRPTLPQTFAVPLAQASLTSLFGMGRG